MQCVTISMQPLTDIVDDSVATAAFSNAVDEEEQDGDGIGQRDEEEDEVNLCGG